MVSTLRRSTAFLGQLFTFWARLALGLALLAPVLAGGPSLAEELYRLFRLFAQLGRSGERWQGPPAGEGLEFLVISSPGLPTLLALPLALLGANLFTLIFVAFFTLLERKLMGLFQRREGPDRLGIEGLGQPFADGLKLLLKQLLVIKDSPQLAVYFFAPIISLWISLVLWCFLPLSSAGALVSSEISLVLVFGFASLSSYGIIFAGWASNSKYALLGAFRSVAQLISYEIVFSLLSMPLMLSASTANLRDFVHFQATFGWFAYMLPLAAIFYLVSLAEASRTPFDLPEAEAELVAGFNVEYAALLFSLFFLGEYSGMGVLSGLYAALFLGGWSLNPLGSGAAALTLGWAGAELGTFGTLLGQVAVSAAKIVALCILFVLIRAALPRLRFDQLVNLCWKFLFPLAFALLLLSAALLLLGLHWGSLTLGEGSLSLGVLGCSPFG